MTCPACRAPDRQHDAPGAARLVFAAMPRGLVRPQASILGKANSAAEVPRFRRLGSAAEWILFALDGGFLATIEDTLGAKITFCRPMILHRPFIPLVTLTDLGLIWRNSGEL